MSNIHHYQNEHLHHIEEKMHDQVHFQVHQMVLYRHDHQFQMIFVDQFYDLNDLILIHFVFLIFDVQIQDLMHYSITKPKRNQKQIQMNKNKRR